MASAMSNIGSALPFLADHKVFFSQRDPFGDGNELAGGESGVVFAIPTYAFIVGVGVMLGWGPVLPSGLPAAGRIRWIRDALAKRQGGRVRLGVPGGAVILVGLCGTDRC